MVSPGDRGGAGLGGDPGFLMITFPQEGGLDVVREKPSL